MLPIEDNTSHIEPSLYTIDKILSTGYLTLVWSKMPVYSNVFTILFRGIQKAWSV
jgi:hypothetical protein